MKDYLRLNLLYLDIENTFQIDDKKRSDPSPYNENNYLVSAGWAYGDAEPIYKFFCTNDDDAVVDPSSYEDLQTALLWADVLIAFNAKYELSWLRACGFTIKDNLKIYCAMIREYVLAKGMKLGMSLEESCIRNQVTHKKSELVEKYLKQGIGFEAMPWEIVQEYGIGDVISCRELYKNQLERLKENQHLMPTIELMEEFCVCLEEIETNGITIDIDALDALEKEYRAILDAYTIDLQKIASEVMGDTPVNLDSPQQLSELIYSRRVINKTTWKDIFNLGSEIRGSVRKPKHNKRYSNRDFVDLVRTHTDIIYKTIAEHCNNCKGTGQIFRDRKDGSSFKRPSKCSHCGGNGFIQKATKQIAGLRCSPNSFLDAATGGFSTDKGTLQALHDKTSTRGIAKEFLGKITEINKLSNYLSTFIEGVRRGIKGGIRWDNDKGTHIGTLHTNFMQSVTATGRLSSRNPNFQNIPRGITFPLKRAIISRYPNGIILSADAKQLEFRIAGELSGDKQIFKDVLDGIDVHSETAKHTGKSRQDSKENTFQPIYGAVEQGKPENIAAYFRYFRERYHEHDKWKKDTASGIIRDGGFYRLPSGREYYFPNTIRYPNGNISNSTIIANYPVQGLATADIMPAYTLLVWNLLKRYNLQSKIIIVVHDDVTLDVVAEEKTIVVDLLREAEATLVEDIKRRYNYLIRIPLEFEIKAGPDWLNMKEI